LGILDGDELWASEPYCEAASHTELPLSDRVVAGCREERLHVEEISKCWIRGENAGSARGEPDIVTQTQTTHLVCRDARTQQPCGYWKSLRTPAGALKAFFDGAVTIIQTTRLRGQKPVKVLTERNIYVESKDRKGETLFDEGPAELGCMF